LTKAFSDLGYVEGKTIHLEYRFPAEQAERFGTLAREPVERKSRRDCRGRQDRWEAAKQASRTIPIGQASAPRRQTLQQTPYFYGVPF
jgi:putative ABC transport system substrate-binding protein